MAIRLVHTSGDLRGNELELVPPGISIGREADNDIVLNDTQVSRYHAKLEYYDNNWFVHDLNSRNGVQLNGQKVATHAPLKVGDELRVGGSVMQVVDESVPAGAGGATAAAAEASAPVGMAEPTMAAKASLSAARRKKLRLLGVALVAVLVVVILLLTMGNPPKPATPPPVAGGGQGQPVSAPHGQLEAHYEKLQASASNVFRYELSISGKILKVVVDDLQNETHLVEEAKELSDEQLAALGTRIMNNAFLNAHSPQAGQPGRELNSERLMVRMGNTGNYLEVANALAPDAFREAVSQLADLAARELYINDRPVPKATILQEAEKEFTRARDLYRKLDVRATNLYDAIMALRAAQVRLKWIEPKPDFFKEAYDLEQLAQKTLDDRVAELISGARLEQQTGRLEEALQKYRQVVDFLPDRNDPRHRTARDAVLDLTRKLEAKKGGK